MTNNRLVGEIPEWTIFTGNVWDTEKRIINVIPQKNPCSSSQKLLEANSRNLGQCFALLLPSFTPQQSSRIVNASVTKYAKDQSESVEITILAVNTTGELGIKNAWFNDGLGFDRDGIQEHSIPVSDAQLNTCTPSTHVPSMPEPPSKE